MTTLTHVQGPLGRPRSSGARTVTGTDAARAHLAAIKRFFAGALGVLAMTAAAAGVIALKAAYFLSHFSH